MTDQPGDIFKDENCLVEEVYSETNTAITKGQVVVFDTDGYRPCVAADLDGVKAFIALSTVTATAATRKKISILRMGYGRALKTTGAGTDLYAGDTPTFDDGGALVNGGNLPPNMIITKDAGVDDTYYEVFVD